MDSGVRSFFLLNLKVLPESSALLDYLDGYIKLPEIFLIVKPNTTLEFESQDFKNSPDY